MDTHYFTFRVGTCLRALLAWIAQTTQESRSARLSTLGLSVLPQNGSHRDDSFGEHRYR